LSSKPEPNPKEHYNCTVFRSGKQLEGPKGVRVEADGQNSIDVSESGLPSEDKPPKKSNCEKPKEPKPPSPKPYMPPLLFP